MGNGWKNPVTLDLCAAEIHFPLAKLANVRHRVDV